MSAATERVNRANSARRAPVSNLQATATAVTYEVEQKEEITLDETDKATKDFMDTFQDKVFEGIIDDSTKIENQIKVEAILEKHNGDVAKSYKEISKIPELYDGMVSKLDE